MLFLWGKAAYLSDTLTFSLRNLTSLCYNNKINHPSASESEAI